MNSAGGASPSNGANVEQRADNGGYHQQWELLDAGDGYYNIRNRNSNQMLDVNGAGTADGANVIQWPANGGQNQQWRLIPAN